MVRVINTDPKMGTSMTENETKYYMTRSTILHVGIVDDKGQI